MQGDERHDLIILMNVLNEVDAPASLLASLVDRLAPHGSVLIIEPALRTVSRGLLALRAEAVERGWTVYAPCFRQGDCPALEHENDWCHDELPWQRPRWYEALDDALGNVKHSLKYSSLLLNRHGATLADVLGQASPSRVVSEAMHEKGRMRLFLCGADGRVPCLRNTRDRSDANRGIDAVARYDIVEIQGEQRRAHDVLIAAETLVRRIPLQRDGAAA
jgi:ribosomal protein RSM22 (predicted rRNA methylase)